MTTESELSSYNKLNEKKGTIMTYEPIILTIQKLMYTNALAFFEGKYLCIYKAYECA